MLLFQLLDDIVQRTTQRFEDMTNLGFFRALDDVSFQTSLQDPLVMRSLSRLRLFDEQRVPNKLQVTCVDALFHKSPGEMFIKDELTTALSGLQAAEADAQQTFIYGNIYICILLFLT